MKKLLFLLLIVLRAFIINAQTEVANIYTNNTIGWSITIPEGWDVLEQQDLEELLEDSKEILDKEKSIEVDYSTAKILLNFSKNDANNFSAILQSFELEYEGEWEENNVETKKIVFKMLEDSGYKLDSTITTQEIVHGTNYRTFSFTINSKKGVYINTMTFYMLYINGYSLTATLTYNNSENRDALLKAFRTSKVK